LASKGPSNIAPATVLPSKTRPGTYVLRYSPEVEGEYNIGVVVNGDSSKLRPVKWFGNPASGLKDPSQVEVRGIPDVAKVGVPIPISIVSKDPDGSERPIGGDPFEIKVTNPDGTETSPKIEDLGNGEYAATIVPNKVGPLSIDVSSNGLPVNSSPFSTTITPDGIEPEGVIAAALENVEEDAGKYGAKVGGPGLKFGQVGKPGKIFLKLLDKETKKPVSVPESAISLNAEGPEGPITGTVNPSKKSPGTYSLQYNPTVPGEYAVAIAVEDHKLKSKKVHWHERPEVVVVDPIRSSISELPDTIALGEPTSFNVALVGPHGEDAPSGVEPLDVVITTPDGSTVPVKIEDLGDGTSVVSFTPETVGPLKIDVGSAGIPLESSPVTVMVTPDGVDPFAALSVETTPNNEHTTPKHKIKVGGEGLHAGRTGHPGKVFVKVFDKQTKLPVVVDADKVGLKVEGPSEATLAPTKASKKKPGLYSLAYSPKEAGLYDVAVVVDNHPTKPHKVEWFPAPLSGTADPHKSKIVGLPPVVASEKPTTFSIVAANPDGSPKTNGGDPFDVHVTKEDGTEVPVTVEDLGDGTYQVQFTPDSLSPLNVNVDLAGLPVDESPLHIAVTPDGIDEPVYSREIITPLYKLRIGGPGLRAGRVGKVGTVHLKVLDKNTSSPVDVNPSTIKLIASDSPAPIGTPTVLSSSKQAGTYAIRYTPTVPGVYNLSIAVGDRNHTPPRAVTISDPSPELAAALSNPATAKLIPVKNLPPSVVVDEPVQFTVSAPPGFEDIPLENPVEVKVTTPDGVECPVTVADLGNGDFQVEFTPTAEGPLEVDVAFGGVPLSDKPFTLEVTEDGVEPESQQHYDTEVETKNYKVRLGGRGLKSGQTHSLAPIFVKVLDKRSNNLIPVPTELIVLDVTGPSTIKPPKVRDSKDHPGTYVIKYSTNVPGVYDVMVVVDGEPTKKRKVPWRAAPADGRMPVLEIKELPLAIAKDKPTSFLVSPIEGSDVPLDVSALDIKLEFPDDVECPVKITPTEDGNALVEFTPTSEGPLDVDVAVNGLPLESIPAVEVTPDGLESGLIFDQEVDTPHYKIRLGGRGLKFGHVGKPASILVKIIDKETKKPATLPTSDISLIPGDVPQTIPAPKVLTSSKQPGTYAIVYSPTQPGVYNLAVGVKKDKTRLHAVNWHKTEENQPDPAKSLIDGLPSVVAVDQPTTFTIIPRSADGSDRPEGGDPIDVKVVGTDDVEVPVKVTDLGNGEYAVSFTPTKEGVLDVDVAVAGEPLLDSPIHVLVTPDGVEPDLKFEHPATYDTPKFKLLVSGPGLKSGTIGTPASVYLKVIDPSSEQPLNIPVTDIVLDAKGPDTISAPKVLASKKQPGTYVVRYSPSEPGAYVVNLFVSGEQTKPKTVNWHLPDNYFPSPELSEVIGLESAVPLEEPVQFILNGVSPDGTPLLSGGAPVDVSVTGEGVDLPVKVEDLGTGEYLVEFTPTKEGPLDVDVAIGGIPLADFSPFHIDATSDGVELPSSISLDRELETPHYKLKIGGPGLKSGRIGRPGSVFVKVMDKETGEPVTVPADDVNLEVTGPAAVSPAKVIPSHKLPGTFVLRYSPEVPGTYKVVLSIGNENETKPITVTWRPSPGPNSADPAKSVISQLEPAIQLDKPCSFSIIPKTADGKTKGTGCDPLDVKVTADDGTEFPVKLVDDGSGEYLVEFTPTKEGPLDVDIAIGGIPIAGSPFPVSVSPDGKDPEMEFDTPLETTNYKLKVGGKGLKTGHLGKPGRIFVKVFDKNDKPVSLPVQNINIDAKGPQPVSPAKVIAHPKATGTYVLRYLPTEEGSYDVSVVVVSDRTRPRAVRWLSGTSSANADKFEMSDLIERYRSGVPSVFKIVPTDPSITYGGEKFTVSIKNDDKEAPVKIQDLENGQYLVEFTPPDVGDMTVTVKLGEDNVVGSPFNAFVVPGPSLRCIVTGDGIFGGPIKVPLRFTVHASVETSRKIRNPVPEDAITVSINGPIPTRTGLSLLSPRAMTKSTPAIAYAPSRPVIPSVSLRRPGIFDVTYTLDFPGDYDIVVSVFGDSVSADPFQAVAVQPRASAAHSSIEIPKVLPVNVPVAIPISAKTDSGEPVKVPREPFDVQVTTKEGKEIVADVYEKNGLYTVKFTPKQVGSAKVDVLLDGVPLTGSPFPITILPRCNLTGDDLKGGNLRNKPMVFEVHFSDDSKRPVEVPLFSVPIQGPNKEEVPVVITPLSDGVYQVQFQPQKGGDFVVQVEVDGKPLLEQPITVSLKNVPELLPIKLAKDPRSDVGGPCVISVPLLESSGAPIDPSTVSVDVDGPEKLKGTIQLDPESAQPSHIIAFNPTKPGTYNVSVNHDGEPLLSPIHCTVLPVIDPLKSEVVGIPETKKGLDEPLSFTVVAKDRSGTQLPVGGLGHENDFAVMIDGDVPLSQEPPKIVDNDDGTFTVTWAPEKPGPYDLTVAYKGNPLSGTPIHLDVIDITSAKYSLMAVTTIKITKVAVLVKAYNTKKDPKSVGGDTVSVYVLGPEGKVDHKVADNNNGTYTVSYYADVPGNYEVHGTINGEPVIGSPKTYTL